MMEKLTPKQRKTINRVVDVLNRYPTTPLSIAEISQHAELSATVVKNTLEVMNVTEQDGKYLGVFLSNLPETSCTPITHFSFIDVLKKSASTILTQDNLGTANPAYVVKSRKKNFGIDENFSDKYVWRDVTTEEGYVDESDGDLFWALTELSRETGKSCLTIANGVCYEKCHYEQIEVSETVCFTREHAQEYIDANRHNLSDPFIYVASFNRNPEMIALRELLICLAENPTMFDGVEVNA